MSRRADRRSSLSNAVAQRLQVIGELDQHDAHVLHHREQHLAQRLELRGVLPRLSAPAARVSAPICAMRTTPSESSATAPPNFSRIRAAASGELLDRRGTSSAAASVSRRA